MTSQPPAPFLRMSPTWSTSCTKPWSVSAVSDWRNDFQRVKTSARVWTFLLPGHCIGIFFLEVLKIRPQATKMHRRFVQLLLHTVPVVFLVRIRNREHLIGSESGGKGEVSPVLLENPSFIFTVLWILWLWVTVKSDTTCLPQVSLAGRSEKAS